jgi:hypothetical protein
MNSPVFLQFELGRAKAQLAAFFAVMPGLQPVALEPKRAKIPDCPDNATKVNQRSYTAILI